MKRTWAGIVLALAVLICFGGCGKNVPQEVVQENVISALTADCFCLEGAVQTGEEYGVQEYIPWKYSTYDEGEMAVYEISKCENGIFYRLFTMADTSSKQVLRWELQSYDVNSGETAVRTITPEEMGRDEITGHYVVDFNVAADGRIQFRWKEIVQGGGILLGLPLSTYDENSSYYAIEELKNGFTLLSPTEEHLWEYKVPEGQEILSPIKTDSGEIIFSITQTSVKNTEFFLADSGKKQLISLGVIEDDWVYQVYGIYGNCLYYESMEGVICWNIQTGKRNSILSFRENGIDHSFSTELSVGQDGVPILRMHNSEQDWVVILGDAESTKQSSIVVANLVGDYASQKMLTEWAVKVGKIDRNLKLTYENAKGDVETYRQKVFAELAAGGGPDILCVSREDFVILQEKGLAANLEEMLSGDLQAQLWPAVKELGSMDGKLYGMASNVRVETILVPDSVQAPAGWTLQDVVRLMKTGQMEPCLYYYNGGTNFYPMATVLRLSQYAGSIDWDTKTSHFGDQIFIDLLAVLGYEPTQAGLGENIFGTGNRAAFVHFGEEDMEWEVWEWVLGGKGFFAGMPTASGNGNFMESDQILIVNAQSSAKDIIKGFLETFWDKDVQKEGIDVRRYNKGEIVTGEDGELYWHEQKLIRNPDGRTSLDAAVELLDNCVAAQGVNADINQILYEELDAMYKEKKKFTEVARIIDSRVQLYLDEQ